MEALLDRFKHSLSTALVQFYPLSGRLATIQSESESSLLVFADCNGSPGEKLIYSVLDITMFEIISPPDVPLVVQSFFYHDRAVNPDGHARPLVSIQVTELLDGVFIGCSMNHAIGEGTGFWDFFNALSEIFHAKGKDVKSISRLPIFTTWFPDGYGLIIYLPLSRSDEFSTRFESPPLRENFFHISAESIVKFKSKANLDVRDMVDKWLQSPPIIYDRGRFFDRESASMGRSPRLNVHGNEFGIGKGIALRSGHAHKFDDKVTSYQGYEVRSIDLEVWLPTDSMAAALESDEEFMDVVSLPHYLR